jgi:hypothetical protein
MVMAAICENLAIKGSNKATIFCNFQGRIVYIFNILAIDHHQTATAISRLSLHKKSQRGALPRGI